MFSFNLSPPTQKDTLDTHILYDLLVIGGGPAGLNGALYAKRKGLQVGIIAKEPGGQLHNTSEVDNYLGFPMITGEKLAHAFIDHAKALSVPMLQDVLVTRIEHEAPHFSLILSNGKTVKSKTVLYTTGGYPRRLNIPGEQEFQNKGVSYCTTCDAPFFKGKHVLVAGGGNSAVEAVLDLAHHASHVTLVHRSQFRADHILLDKMHALSNVDIKLMTQIIKIEGQTKMEKAVLYDKVTEETYDFTADGIFIEIGTVPNATLVSDLVKLNEQGEIIVDAMQATSLPGFYAAGDVTNQPFRQIIISAAEGAKAALAITNYLNTQYKGE